MPAPLMARRGAAQIAVLTIIGCGPDTGLAQQGQDQNVREQLGAVPTAVDTTTAASLSQTFRAAAATALPSVVTVTVTAQPQMAQQSTPFNLPFPFGQRGQGQDAPPEIGTGSGFVFTADGHIITNNHVVENATDVQVRFPDGRIYDDVEVVGRDPNTDIAVVRIRDGDDTPFAPLEIGDSDRLQVGDWVLALGNPLALGFTVTAGIVSAKGRSIGILPNETGLESFIQTDAAINRGNSGGPLVDLFGRVVGINTAILSPTGMYAGNGFAVPSAIAVRAARDIIEYGYVRRPRIGVRVRTVGEAQAELYGLDRIAGAYVSEVDSGSPAEEAGLRAEDVIVSVDGDPVETSSDLTTRLAREDPGDEVRLGVVRAGERREIEVELGEFEVEQPDQPEPRTASAEQRLGLEFQNLTPQILRELGVRGDLEGVVITAVNPYGPAAGLVQRGDIILEFARQRVTGVRELQRLADDIEREDIVVLRIRSVATGNDGVVSFRVR